VNFHVLVRQCIHFNKAILSNNGDEIGSIHHTIGRGEVSLDEAPIPVGPRLVRRIRQWRRQSSGAFPVDDKADSAKKQDDQQTLLPKSPSPDDGHTSYYSTEQHLNDINFTDGEPSSPSSTEGIVTVSQVFDAIFAGAPGLDDDPSEYTP
jgi:hypothetical protein